MHSRDLAEAFPGPGPEGVLLHRDLAYAAGTPRMWCTTNASQHVQRKTLRREPQLAQLERADVAEMEDEFGRPLADGERDPADGNSAI